MVAGSPQQATSLQRRRRCTGTSCKHPITGEAIPHISEKILGEILLPCTPVMEKLVINTPVIRLLESDEAEKYLEFPDSELRTAGFLKLMRGSTQEIWEIDSRLESSVSPQRLPNQRPRACETCDKQLKVARKIGKVLTWRYKVLRRGSEELRVTESVILVG